MEAIILAGGFGTRLRYVVPDLPKPMAPVNGKPFLEILFGSLARKDFTRVILSLGYKADLIKSHFGSRFNGIEVDYVVEDQPLGTGGAIRLAMEKVTKDHIFIFNGDTYLDLEAHEIEQDWLKNSRPKIIGREVLDTARYGRLIVEKSRVTGFSEKGASGPGLINAGCYVFSKNELNAFAPGAAFSVETDYLMQNVDKKHFDIFVTEGKFIDIGIPEDYARAQIELKDL